MSVDLPFPDVSALLSGDVCASSVAAYQGDLRLYVRFCAQAQLSPLDAASLLRWRHALVVTTRLSPHTVNRRLVSVKLVVQAAALQHHLAPTMAQDFQQVGTVSLRTLRSRLKYRHTPISPHHMRQLCDAPDPDTLRGLRDRALLLTLATSGCRIGEALALRLGDLRPQGDGMVFVAVLGKTDLRERLAPLTQEAYQGLQRWLVARPVESRYLFTAFDRAGTRPTGRRMHHTSAWRMVRKYAAQVGVPPALSPHAFRRFVGTALAKKDLRIAQRVLGHADISTTARHYVLDQVPGGVTEGLF